MTSATDKQPRQILVIGSEGFIGKHVVREFDSMPGEYEVFTCDIVAGEDASRHWDLDPFSVDFDELFGARKFDLCINCSGAASVAESYQDPQRDFELNVANVGRILDAIRKADLACRFLNLSSAAVYGNPASLPISEQTEARPISPYGLHKHQAEQMCRDFVDRFGLRTCSIRIFSAYGPMLRKQLFWDLHCKAESSREVELWGTGKESRDFIESSDLARAIRIVCEESAFAGEVVNVANGQEVRIEEAVRLFLENYGSEYSYVFNGRTREGDPRNWCADISLLSSLGYRPSVSIERGVRNYVAWLKDSRK